MKNKEIKKVFVNGVLASVMCANMVGCDNAEALTEEKETTTSITTSNIETTIIEETTVATTHQVIENNKNELTMEEILEIDKLFTKQMEEKVNNISNYIIENKIGQGLALKPCDNNIALIYVFNEQYISDEEKNRMIESGLIPNNTKELLDKYDEEIRYITLINSTYLECDSNIKSENDLICIESIIPDDYKEIYKELNKQYVECIKVSAVDNKNNLVVNKRTLDYDISGEILIECALKEFYDAQMIYRSLSLYTSEDIVYLQDVLDRNSEKTRLCLEKEFENENVKEKTLVKE